MSNRTGMGLAVSIGSLIAVAISVFGIIYAMGVNNGKMNTKILTINCQVSDHENRLRRLEELIAEQRPIWRAVARELGVPLNNNPDSLK